jgi:predicted RNA polymerase sigma factor
VTRRRAKPHRFRVRAGRLAEQDRGAWNRQHIDEGIALITGTLSRTPLGPYQLQTAIAAVHDEAAHAEDTPWSRYLIRFIDRGQRSIGAPTGG